jgi:DNA-binding NarL/FixJ family response regulator
VIRVLIVAPALRARRALESRLISRSFEIAGSFATLEAASGTFEGQADAILLEAGEPARSEVIDSLEETGLASQRPVVALLEEASPEVVTELLRLGVRAILPSDADPEQIAIALAGAVRNLMVLAPRDAALARPAGISARNPPDELPEPLTPREREVLRLLASGLGNKEIGVKLQISEHTAKFHVASILGKLGASTRAEAVSLGMRHGLILL